MVWHTQMEVAPVALSDMGSRRMGGGIAARLVWIMERFGTFTKFFRRFRYLGSQMARVTFLSTTSPVAVDALESHFVAGRSSRLENLGM